MTDQQLQELRRESHERREAIARDVDLVADRVAPGRIADRQKAKLRHGVSGIRDSLFGTPDRHRATTGPEESLTKRASDTLADARHAAPQAVGDFTEGNPLAAGLIGIGIGLLAATLIPSSPEEQRVVDHAQSALDEAASGIGRAGQQAAEAVAPKVMDAVDEVKESARESVDHVASDAKAATDDVRQTATTEARDVREHNDPAT